MQRAYRARSRDERQRGQVVVLMAAGLVGMLMFAGLAVDGSRGVLNQNRAQSAADGAALAAAFQMNRVYLSQLPPPLVPSVPPDPGDAAVPQVEAAVALGGFATIPAYRCDGGVPLGTLDVTFYSTAPNACPMPADQALTSGLVSVRIQVPPAHPPGGTGTGCSQYTTNCVEITVTYIQPNLLSIGRPTTTIQATAIGLEGAPPQLVW